MTGEPLHERGSSGKKVMAACAKISLSAHSFTFVSLHTFASYMHSFLLPVWTQVIRSNPCKNINENSLSN